MPRVVSKIKQKALSFVGETNAPRRILWGINRGVKMNLDLASDSQTYVGIAERELAKYFESLSRDIQTAIDVGGSIGVYTLFFLTKTPVKQVFCFEPEPESQEKISANLRLNGLEGDPRVHFVKKFVGSRDDDQYTSLNRIADRIVGPCLIKIDVEGAEIDVLHGATQLLGRSGIRWIIETHSAQLERECISVLKSAGLTHEVVDKAWWRAILPELRLIEHNRWLVAR